MQRGGALDRGLRDARVARRDEGPRARDVGRLHERAQLREAVCARLVCERLEQRATDAATARFGGDVQADDGDARILRVAIEPRGADGRAALLGDVEAAARIGQRGR